MRAVVLVPLLASACLRSTTHQCASTEECGPSGTCEPSGACSFPDDECKSGQRYGEDTGPLAGECVTRGGGDAPDGDGGPDGGGGAWDYGDGHHGPLTINIAVARLNGYGALRSPAQAGSRMLDVQMQSNATVGGWGARYEVGDRVIVWQTVGLADATVSGGSAPLVLEGIDGTPGRWFESRVTAVNNGIVMIAERLPVDFTTDAQVVHVPELTQLFVGDGRMIVPQAWNGEYGGIVAFYAEDLLLERGTIEGGETGFRGGQAENFGMFMGCSNLDGKSSTGGGARKGESLAPGRYGGTDTASGRGNLGHGGGGGDCHNAGGGGGGHGATGGRGGSDQMGRVVGGMGGAPVVYAPDAFFAMGGGGGAGERNNGTAANGGTGGGVVFVTARTITCSGDLSNFDTDGGPGDGSENDGGGGGGAGGMVLIRAETITGCGAGADGGNGGGDIGGMLRGPGGGGSGGRVWIVRESGDDLRVSAGQGPRGVGGLDDAQNGSIGSICGNGTVETGETCDDGNFTYGDGCSYCRD